MKARNFDMQVKERGCAAVEAYMIRTEDKTDVKKYINLLDKLGRDAGKSAAVNTFHEVDRARYYLGMVFGEPGCIRERIGNLKDGTGKGYAVLALAAAQEKLNAAREGAAHVDVLVEKGARDSVARFQSGRDSALDLPFPLIAVEKELRNVMDCLAGAFAALDIGIGRIEETEGMECKDGHYWNLADGALWEGGTGEQAWLDVLWPMRSLEKMIISAQDKVHDAACRVDGMRPKARSIIKKHALVPGFLWEQEKERERIAALMSGHEPCRTVYLWNRERMGEQADSLRVAENAAPATARDGSGQKNGSRKTSLRKRLKMAGDKSHTMYEKASLQGQKSRIGERQR